MDAAFWLSLLERFGLPVALLVVAIVAVYKFAQWLRPRADRVIDGHINFLAVNTEINKSLAESQKTMEKSAEARHAQMTAKLDDVHEIVKSWHGRWGEGPK